MCVSTGACNVHVHLVDLVPTRQVHAVPAKCGTERRDAATGCVCTRKNAGRHPLAAEQFRPAFGGRPLRRAAPALLHHTHRPLRPEPLAAGAVAHVATI